MNSATVTEEQPAVRVQDGQVVSQQIGAGE
jgi:hypothetical protein